MKGLLNERIDCVKKVAEVINLPNINYKLLGEYRANLKAWNAFAYVYKIDQIIVPKLTDYYFGILKRYKVTSDDDAWALLVQFDTDIDLLDTLEILKL